jgi:hypothetical protein
MGVAAAQAASSSTASTRIGDSAREMGYVCAAGAAPGAPAPAGACAPSVAAKAVAASAAGSAGRRRIGRGCISVDLLG